MIPTQPKQFGPYVIALVFVVFMFKNPEKAAHFINQAFDAVSRFVSALA